MSEMDNIVLLVSHINTFKIMVIYKIISKDISSVKTIFSLQKLNFYKLNKIIINIFNLSNAFL